MYIDYIVVANKQDEIPAILGKLNAGAAPNPDVENALRSIYGPSREDWKPFGNMTVKELMHERQNTFESRTPPIPFKAFCANQTFEHAIDNDEYQHIQRYRVYFIDILTIYNDKINAFEMRNDSLLANRDYRCCFVLTDHLPEHIEKKVKQDFLDGKKWKVVKYNYNQGFLHKIVTSSHDMKNFISYVVRGITDHPEPQPNFLGRYEGPDNSRNVPRIGS